MFVCSILLYQSCEHDVLKTNKPILLQIGTDAARGINEQLFGVSRSEVSRSLEANVGRTHKRDISKMDDLILLHIDTNGRCARGLKPFLGSGGQR